MIGVARPARILTVGNVKLEVSTGRPGWAAAEDMLSLGRITTCAWLFWILNFKDFEMTLILSFKAFADVCVHIRDTHEVSQ